MCRRLFRLLFLNLVFITGMLVGSINASKVISYAKHMDDYKKVEQEELKKKPQPLKKKQSHRIRVV